MRGGMEAVYDDMTGAQSAFRRSLQASLLEAPCFRLAVAFAFPATRRLSLRG